LRLNPKGSDFQRQVLEVVARIPYGETTSYSDIARMVGKPKAVRAVGTSNRNNPIPIIVPCHRVIGSNGKLTGFSGGVECKQWLLNLEAGKHAPVVDEGEVDSLDMEVG
jgi:O-6-methylguanine DNA methyltransferase